MMPWVRQVFQPAPLLVGREVIWSTRGVQEGDLLGHLLFVAGIQAALGALPQGGALHRWYLDDGVFLGSLAEVEEVLGVLRWTLPPLGLELNMRKTTVWGPGLVTTSSPSQPRRAFDWRMARRYWGFQSTPPYTTCR